MNTKLLNPPPNDPDRLFSAFFRAELPSRWPAAPRPWADQARTAPANPGADTATRSRWALAASVALLLGGCWFLSGQLNDGKGKKGFDLNDGTANPKHVKDLGKAPPKLP